MRRVSQITIDQNAPFLKMNGLQLHNYLNYKSLVSISVLRLSVQFGTGSVRNSNALPYLGILYNGTAIIRICSRCYSPKYV